MAVFRKVPPDGQKGKISYNAGIVSGIVNLAVSEVEGVHMHSGKKKGLRLYFEKEGIYAESGMGCTGPIVLMADDKRDRAYEILKNAGYVG